MKRLSYRRTINGLLILAGIAAFAVMALDDAPSIGAERAPRPETGRARAATALEFPSEIAGAARQTARVGFALVPTQARVSVSIPAVGAAAAPEDGPAVEGIAEPSDPATPAGDALARIDRVLAALPPEAVARNAAHLAAFADLLALVEVRAASGPLAPRDRALFFDAGLRALDPFARYTAPDAGQVVRPPGFLAVDLDGAYVIESVVMGSAAAQAGLAPGDRITAINGIDVRGEAARTINGAIEALLAEADGRLRLRVAAPGRDREVVLAMPTAARAHGVYDLGLRGEDGNVAHLRVHDLQAGVASRIEDILERRQADGTLSGAVLDLRGAPGGRTDAAVALLDLFVPAGTPLYHVEGRARAAETQTAPGPARFGELPLAVLIDGRTASAVEIVAAALRDRPYTAVVGWQSRGKTSVQVIHPLRDGRARLTVAGFEGAGGADLSNGVVPDITMPGSDPARRPSRFEPDRPLDRALSALADMDAVAR